MRWGLIGASTIASEHLIAAIRARRLSSLQITVQGAMGLWLRSNISVIAAV